MNERQEKAGKLMVEQKEATMALLRSLPPCREVSIAITEIEKAYIIAAYTMMNVLKGPEPTPPT